MDNDKNNKINEYFNIGIVFGVAVGFSLGFAVGSTTSSNDLNSFSTKEKTSYQLPKKNDTQVPSYTERSL